MAAGLRIAEGTAPHLARQSPPKRKGIQIEKEESCEAKFC